MGTHSSSTKNQGWAVAQRRCLNGSTIPAQGPTLDAKLAASGQGTELTCIIVLSMLRRSQPDHSYIVQHGRLTRSLVAKFP